VLAGETPNAVADEKTSEDADSADTAVYSGPVGPLRPIRMEQLTSVQEIDQATRLLWKVWDARSDTERSEVMNASALRALAFSGNYVFGAYYQEKLVGCSVGFFGCEPGGSHKPGILHSHIVGVDPSVQNRGVGFEIKKHQRDWARAKGLTTIEWTFDPLVRRNAHVNLCKLAATVVSYEPDFYGALNDGINTNEHTDRLVVRWRLDDPAVAAAVDRGASDRVADLYRDHSDAKRIQVPRDIEALRRETPQEAEECRHRVRSQFRTFLKSGYEVVGLTSDGEYVLLPHKVARPLGR
jgi:predicted GNAT superfamily acetyltransferase